MIIKFVDDTFVEPYYPTIEQPYYKQVPFNGVEYDVSIIDTAGQDEYSLLSAKHAVGIHGYILVYSITNRQSFDMVRIVYEKLRNFQVCFCSLHVVAHSHSTSTGHFASSGRCSRPEI